ncbi:hypothetical protein F2Q69_00030352 [Brassica cretica]|uniref:Uncharacterized protein n=1 Tax=Brassica cretica TaxID=69181 RepID=A0A8S9RWM1_BRACR|nr:hypothetical protein F2Q69_00030352 [Brassica cretica]
MNGASPAHSSVSTTAVAGGGGSSGAAAGLDDFPFPPDIPSMQDRKDEAIREMTRGHERINKMFASSNILGIDDAVLKTDLMGELDKEVKSLEEDSWMFQGPRSRIHLISRRGYLLLSLNDSKQ